MRVPFLSLTLLLASSIASAAEPRPAPGGAPPPPPQLQSGQALEPEITIRRERRRTVYSYSVNGQTYMVRVVPRWGRPYYVLDTDGDGQFDVRQPDPGMLPVQQWELFSW